MQRHASIIPFLVVSFLAPGCQESLPVYEAPDNLVEVSVLLSAPPKINYSHMDVNDPSFISLNTSIQWTQVAVVVKNVFDETLQDDAFISGFIEIRHAEHPEIYRKITLGRADAGGSGLIDPITGILTIGPGQSLAVFKLWDYKDSTGKYVFWGTPAQEGHVGGGPLIREHEPIPFRVRGTIQVFARTAQIRSKEVDLNLNFIGTIYAPP